MRGPEGGGEGEASLHPTNAGGATHTSCCTNSTASHQCHRGVYDCVTARRTPQRTSSTQPSPLRTACAQRATTRRPTGAATTTPMARTMGSCHPAKSHRKSPATRRRRSLRGVPGAQTHCSRLPTATASVAYAVSTMLTVAHTARARKDIVVPSESTWQGAGPLTPTSQSLLSTLGSGCTADVQHGQARTHRLLHTTPEPVVGV